MKLLTYDALRVRYYVAGQPIHMTLKEVRLLNALRGAAPDVLSVEELYCWMHDDDDRILASNTVKAMAARVRRKLDAAAPGLGDQIVSVRGDGYKWEKEQ